MKYCKKCVEPDTRPGCFFDEEGVCFPCRYAEKLDEIDWDARYRELQEIASWGKARNRSGYDCIVPVSGGKDSTRQAFFVRDELGLKPLLVSFAFPPEIQTHIGAYNLANLTNHGFDTYISSPAPGVCKELIRLTFYEFCNIYKSTELMLYACAARVATFFGIPLIVYGENPALMWGNMEGALDGDASKLKNSNTLKKGDISPYLEFGFSGNELYWYQYPSDYEMERANLRMIFLGFFLKDFNDDENFRFSFERGLKTRSGVDATPERCGQLFPRDALDCDFAMVNQMLKHVKLGFGKVTEQCAVQIRSGLMDRDEGIELVKKFDGKCSRRYVNEFCKYLGITEDEFWEVTEKFRNKDIWELCDNDWRLKYPSP